MVKNIIKSSLILSIAAIPMFMANSVNISSVKAVALACSDTDGNDIYTAGTLVTTDQFDANGNLISLGETVLDTCYTIGADGRATQGPTGDYLQEGTCTDTTTGSITLTSHKCANGCSLGACNPETVVLPVATTQKVESKGTITSLFENGVIINGIKLYIVPTSTVKYNDYLTSIVTGQKAEYKGFKNEDGSVTVIKIEVRN